MKQIYNKYKIIKKLIIGIINKNYFNIFQIFFKLK